MASSDQVSSTCVGKVALECDTRSDVQALGRQVSVQPQPQETNVPEELDLRLKYNAALPIHGIPTEVFVQVIHHHMVPHIKFAGYKYYQRLISLSGVCAFWCRVIRDSPPLWSRIYETKSLELFQTVVQRSSGHPLDVVSYNPAHGNKYTINLGEILGILTEHRERWRGVVFKIPKLWLNRDIPALQGPAPNLEKLLLAGQDSMPNTPEIDIFGGVAPRLKELTLKKIAIPWDSKVLHNLTVLHLSKILFPSVDTIIRVLSHSPQLQEVTFDRCETERTASSSTHSIQLPHLSQLHMHLGNTDAMEYLLDHIEVPRSCSLASHLQLSENVEDFMLRKVLKWMSKWKPSVLVPFEGLSLDIGDELRVELSIQGHPGPLYISLAGLRTDQFQVALPLIIDSLASWTTGGTTLRLSLGSPPLRSQASVFAQFIGKELSRLPPITSLDVSDTGNTAAIGLLIQEGATALFRSVRTLSLSRLEDHLSARDLELLSKTIQALRDVADGPSDRPNHTQQLQRLELRILPVLDLEDDEIMKKAVITLEGIVGIGKVFVVDINMTRAWSAMTLYGP